MMKKKKKKLARILTRDGDSTGGLHGCAVAIVRITRDLPHVPRHVLDHSDHVARLVLEEKRGKIHSRAAR